MSDIPELEKAFFEDLPLPRLKDNKWGYTDHKGNEVIPFIFREANYFYDELAKVRRFNDPKYGFINPQGKVLIPFIFDRAKEFCNGYCTIKIGRKWGLINTSGAIVIKCEYDFVGSVYEEHGQMVAEVVKDGYKSLINSHGEILLDFT